MASSSGPEPGRAFPDKLGEEGAGDL